MIRITTATLLSIALSGCATTTGVISTGGDTYSVAREDVSLTASLAKLKAAAYQDATAHCAGQGKTMQLIESKDTPRSLGQFPQVEVRFRCVAKG